MEELLAQLNEEQIKPVCDTEGAVLVLAGAGSGKTRVLTTRIAYILHNGLCRPKNILAITFTNKAAKEMNERVASVVGENIRDMWICTIHSMCVKILRAFGKSLDIEPNFSIYAEQERANVIKKCYQDLDIEDDDLLKATKTCIADAKMLGLSPEEYAIRNKDEKGIDIICKVYARYEEELKKNNALDFDDLLLYTLRLLKKDEEAREYLGDKFKYILVDEFQDTNGVQYAIIKLLARVHGNLFVVGDDDQSIYGWRGAEIENILRFDRDYPGAKVYKLQRNYRSTGNILSLANEIIKNNGVRHKKTLWTEADDGAKPVVFQAEEERGEAIYTASTIYGAVRSGAKYKDFAVLMRINALTRAYEQEFANYGIPYKVFGGFKFLERKEIKDVLAYLRLISNPYDDEAFARIINVPKRGIGGKTLATMQEYALQTGLSLFDACVDADYLPLGESIKTKLKLFAKTMKSFVIEAWNIPVSQTVKNVINGVNLRSAYDDKTEEGDAKLANLDEFIAGVEEYSRLNPDSKLDEYLNQITLASDTDDMNDGDYVTLATIHSVKGLEFERVFVCGLEDGIMPAGRNAEGAKLEEERRLMYVAITRAKKYLYLTRSKSRFLYGHREATITSRFLKELSSKIDVGDTPARRDGFGNSNYGNSNYGGYGSGNNYGNGYGYKKYSYSGENGRPVPRRNVYTEDDYYGNRPVQRPQNPAPRVVMPTNANPTPRANSVKKYEVGMTVRHLKFGLGTVQEITGNGAFLKIKFDTVGVKELSSALAPLQIVNK